MQQEEKEEEEREEEEGWRSSRKRRRSSERRHHVHPSLSASAAPWRRQHRPHRIPQGYKNSPTIFGEQLAKDLESWEPPPGEGQLLQYVDDLLRATWTQETCVDCTEQGIALGILAQNLGPYQRAVAYLSKQLDTAAKGWPSGSTGEPVIHECLETIEATYSSRQDLKDTPLEDAETCLLMEAAMSSVEEDMLELEDAAIVAALTSLSKAYGLVLRDTSYNLIPSHGKMSRSSFEWIDQPDSGAGPV
ncbi:hypothetical protein DUI87_25841 [Hirundo rustica rustica]|uniref:Uncharacterized protein n=1 Tax=Hirundo rustica rustica TaxID=333673 RepID=A0A3M0JBP2_HIRRU|nr:hypothetical protein DUI87_25841 [Hirundo rustica rustica]